LKAEYINPVITSLSSTLEMIFNIKPQKGTLSKEEALKTSKDFTIVLELKGDIKGHFAFGFEEETAFKMVKIMTGMEVNGQLDELGLSCLTELGGMARGNIINAIEGMGYKFEISESKLLKENELPTNPNKTALKFTLDTEIGEIETNISLYKNN